MIGVKEMIDHLMLPHQPSSRLASCWNLKHRAANSRADGLFASPDHDSARPLPPLGAGD